MDPQGFYDKLQKERVTKSDGFWFMSHYKDVSAFMKSPLVTNKLLGAPQNVPLREGLLQQDPPKHGKLRSTVNAHLNQRPVAQLQDRVHDWIRCELEKKKHLGRMECMHFFGEVLPHLMLSLWFPLEAHERSNLLSIARRWANRTSGDGSLKDIFAAQDQDLTIINRFFASSIEKRISSGKHRGDVLDTLLEMEAANRISRSESLDMCLLLTIAGVETTVNALGSCMVLLEENPGVQEQLRSDRSLIPKFFEETLRLQPPVRYSSPRTPIEDLEINGLKIPAGTPLVGLFGAANRDPEAFDQPNTLIIGRKGNPHLGFGYGVHHCAGVHLARVNAIAMLENMFDLIPQWQVSHPSLWRRLTGKTAITWRPNFMLQGPEHVHIKWS